MTMEFQRLDSLPEAEPRITAMPPLGQSHHGKSLSQSTSSHFAPSEWQSNINIVNSGGEGSPTTTTTTTTTTTASTSHNHNHHWRRTHHTATASATPPTLTPPPDGGLTAWLQIVGAHFLFFNSWGLVLSYGSFHTYYVSTLLKDRAESDISWVGTFQGFLLFLVGVFTGPIFDKGYFRSLIVTGTVLVVLGLMMTSLCEEYWQVFLAQGVCVGLGAGCLFLPSVGISTTYFSKKRAVATGLASAGGSTGGVIYTVLFRRLLPHVGFPWTVRTLAFLSLLTLSISITLMRTRLPPPPTTRPLFDGSAWKLPVYDVFSLGLFVGFLGIFLPFFYLPLYGASALGLEEGLAFYLVSVLNGASFFGRIIAGCIADRLGALNSMTFFMVSTGVVGFGWAGVEGKAGVIAWSCVYGFLAGAVVSLPYPVVAGITPNLSLVGTWMGMSFVCAGVGMLVGSPIAGVLIGGRTGGGGGGGGGGGSGGDAGGVAGSLGEGGAGGHRQGEFLGLQLFGAATTLAGGLLFLLARWIRWKRDGGWKA
ncbi:MAG: hypothetical protein M1831_005055 [Alyxoria varia]|nr:MAG: hypothetical protein M1831_005055 [Alyxoria varia]